ncbi:MAG: hypothetical protein ACRECH_11460 [Nitrososphaerales archaeon]
MISILGIGLRDFITRIASAILYGFFSLVLFLVIPDALLNGPAGALGFSTSIFFDYAILIVILSGMQGVFRGKFLGDAATVANGFVQIYYLFLITDGGVLNYFVQQYGINLTIDFRTLLYLLMIPSALSVIKAVIHASTRASVRPIETNQELIRL